VVRSTVTTVESSDRELAIALAALTAFPSAEAHMNVARAYGRAGVRDKAHEHLVLVVELEPRNAAAYDEMARILRDWGFPRMALPDAHRAVYHAPRSPEAHNTLGTVFQALGSLARARGEYEKAVALHPGAAYALNNLCSLDLVAREPAAALRRCAEALRVDPTLYVASQNLERARTMLRTSALETPDGQQ